MNSPINGQPLAGKAAPALHAEGACCGPAHKIAAAPAKKGFLKVLEKVCAIALGAFAALLSLKLFVPFFLIGVGIGAYDYFKGDRTAHHHHDHAHAASGCSYGLVEQLTGVRLPVVVSLIANMAMTLAHMEHHVEVFVPVIATTLGAWAGESLMHAGSLACRRWHPEAMRSCYA